MDHILQIHTFGGLGIKLNGEPVNLPLRKAEALLVYLAYTGRPQPREMLTELLWEERAQTIAQKDFRVALSSLTSAIGSLVIKTNQTVGLDLTACRLDTAEFKAITSALYQRPGTASLSPSDVSRLEHAARLYQGEFLAGFYVRDNIAFNEWVDAERERLRQQVTDLLFALAEHALKHGTYPSGITFATQSLQIDPLREDTYYQLMLLLSRNGQRTAALIQYETCRRLLADELGIEPGEQVRRLYEELRTGAPKFAPTSEPLPYRVPSLPQPPTPFVGREIELTRIGATLADPACRLMTLVGPGGIGKTRLAIQAASEQLEFFPNGVYFVALAAVTTIDQVPLAIADALTVHLDGKTAADLQVSEHLRDKIILLVLDNFEQLVDGADLISKLLNYAPGLKILATSREHLNLQEEWLFRVNGMHIPDNDTTETPEVHSAIRLFEQSARRAKQGFSLRENLAEVIQICRQLEGIPLAIELAASWLQIMPATAIVREISRGFDFLATSLRNIPERHRSLRASFEVSWRLLADAERSALLGVAVFRGGFDLASAEYVAGSSSDILRSLAQKSLVQGYGTGRFNLHEVVCHYAIEKAKQSDELDRIKQRHLDYFIQLAEQLSSQLRGRQQADSLDCLELEHDNMRSALSWALDNGKTIAALRLSGALWPFWSARGYLTEGRSWLNRALSNDGGSLGVRAAAFHGAGVLAYSQGSLFSAFTYFQESLAIQTALEDNAGIAASLNGLGLVASSRGDYEEASRNFETSLALRRAMSSKLGMASTMNHLAFAKSNYGDHEKAQALYRESLALERDLDDKQGIAVTLNNQGVLAIDQGRFDEAQLCLEESLAIRRELKLKSGVAQSLYNLGLLLLNAGTSYNEAQRLLAECLSIRNELEDEVGIASALNTLAIVALHTGDYAETRSLAYNALAKFQQLGFARGIAAVSNTIANLLLEEQQYESAYRYQLESLIIYNDLGDKKCLASCLRGLSCILPAMGERAQALRIRNAANVFVKALGLKLSPYEQSRYFRHLTRLPNDRKQDTTSTMLDGISNSSINDDLSVESAHTIVREIIAQFHSRQT